ncbi:hypothetical protein KDAU_43900 [Dictyobacter aurantiacus]|uniref:Uncharacterized protein n=1 Tax=Dictyobacter aurantiacus TaxID=1936993 RepID=A0A401ZJN3_9CHLR|nr:hypothetical protein KDAU_43900 [Dictyobacter aurantiacus]
MQQPALLERLQVAPRLTFGEVKVLGHVGQLIAGGGPDVLPHEHDPAHKGHAPFANAGFVVERLDQAQEAQGIDRLDRPIGALPPVRRGLRMIVAQRLFIFSDTS